MTTRTVQGILYHPVGGLPWASINLYFRLIYFFTDGVYTYPPENYTITTDVNGAFTTSLAVPTTGTAAYECLLPGVNGYNKFTFNVQAGAAMSLNDIIALIAPPAGTPSTLQTLIDAHATLQSSTLVSAHAPFATTAEAQAGALTTKAINPATLKAYFQQPIQIGVNGTALNFSISSANATIPWVLHTEGPTLNAVRDDLLRIGFNWDVTGDATRAQMGIQMENDYFDTVDHNSEWIFIWVDPTTAISRRPYLVYTTYTGAMGHHVRGDVKWYDDNPVSSPMFHLTTGGTLEPATASYWLAVNGAQSLRQKNTSGTAIPLLYIDGSDIMQFGTVVSNQLHGNILTDGYIQSTASYLEAKTSLKVNSENAIHENGTANIGVGEGALAAAVPGNYSTGVGQTALNKATGAYNTAIGSQAGAAIVTGTTNVMLGTFAGTARTGSGNTLLGYYTGGDVSGGSNNVFVGAQAGFYETGSNVLMIDNAPRASEADARTKALIYGIFAAAVANQSLTFNAANMGFFGHVAAAQPLKANHNNWAAASDVAAALAELGLVDSA